MARAYTIPDMPLECRVWYAATEIPPLNDPDQDQAKCSCSPCKPEHFYSAAAAGVSGYYPGYIIRMMPDPGLSDNYLYSTDPARLPATVLEIPKWSGHFYLAQWCHQVGAGFPNHHARIYAVRWSAGDAAEKPWFRGWI